MFDLLTATADLIAALFIGICVWSSMMTGRTRPERGRVFTVMLFLVFVMLICQGFWYMPFMDGKEIPRRILFDISNLSYFALLGSFSYYMWSVCDQKRPISRFWYRINIGIATAGGLYWMYVQQRGLFFDQSGKLVMTAFYYVGQVFGYLIVILLIIMLITNITLFSPSRIVLYFLYFGIPLTLSILRATLGIPNLVYFSIAVVFFLLYQFEHIEAQRRMLIEKNRMTEAELAMMIQQVQPHFMYNVFNSIYYLCDKDPSAAQEAIGEFADYFRVNLDAITTQKPINIMDEIRNTEMYVYLEKLRFEDNLVVEYDIGAKDFQLPALAIRPLVGNAVKHNMNKTDHPLHVRISTREFPDRYEVTVRDDGVGYKMGVIPDDGRKHVGLANLRRRLELICGGSLEISGKSGVGTIAVIKLPKRSR